MNTRIKTDITKEILTSDEVSTFIKFEDSDNPETSLIKNMITAVRTHFEKRTGLSFIEKTYETFFRCGESPFYLPVSPVISVDTVEKMDYEGTKTELTLNTDYYKRGFYDIEILPTLNSSANPLTAFGGNYDLFVTYKAGYGHSDTEKLPEDLMEAMKRQIAQWYDNRDDFRELNILGGIEKILQSHRTTWI